MLEPILWILPPTSGSGCPDAASVVVCAGHSDDATANVGCDGSANGIPSRFSRAAEQGVDVAGGAPIVEGTGFGRGRIWWVDDRADACDGHGRVVPVVLSQIEHDPFAAGGIGDQDLPQPGVAVADFGWVAVRRSAVRVAASARSNRSCSN